MTKLLSAITLLLLIISAGCSGSKQTNSDMQLPEKRVQVNDAETVQALDINVKCDDDCNNTNAIVLKIYQLRNEDKFRNSNYESLMKNPEEVLGDDIIQNYKYEKTLVPGESIQIKKLEINNEAKYLGIIGDFNSPAPDGWHEIISLDSLRAGLEISVHDNSLSYK